MISYDLEYEWVDLLVNTVDYYEGTVLLEPGSAILVINSEGDWQIQFGDVPEVATAVRNVSWGTIKLTVSSGAL